jgi:membrane fusion protein, multidrug efflux system
VPLSQVYVVANYREVQLQHVKAGQPATIRVDAYNIDVTGTVVDVPAATGTTFTPLQPENATGNFTKIVQRLPVRIDLAPGQPLVRLLRVGLSVETTIHTGFANVVAMAPDAGKNGVSNVPPE